MQESQERVARIQQLLAPIKTWVDTMGEQLGQAKATSKRCLRLRQADQAIDLDDDGAINPARLDWERKRNRAAESEGVAEWFLLTLVGSASSMSGYVLT